MTGLPAVYAQLGVSSLARRLHSDTGLRDLVRTQRWDALVAALGNGQAQLANLPGVDTSEDFGDQVRDALLNGKALPKDFARQFADDTTRRHANEALTQLVTQVSQGFAAELSQLAADALPTIWAALDQRLQGVLDTAGRLDLAGIGDAEQAITNDKVQEWTQLRDLHEQYLTIRTSHAVMLQEVDPSALADGRRWHRLFRGVAEAWPTWFAQAAGAPGLNSQSGWSFPQIVPPWPEDDRALDHFQYVVNHRTDLQPWIASAAAIRQQWEEDRAAFYQANETGAPGRQETSTLRRGYLGGGTRHDDHL